MAGGAAGASKAAGGGGSKKSAAAKKTTAARRAIPEQSGVPADEPQDLVAIKNILKAMGVTEYEPGVLHLLMNYMYRCVGDIVGDAERYAALSGQREVDYDHVMLAVQSMQTQQGGNPVPLQEDLKTMAAARNEEPLPKPTGDPRMSTPTAVNMNTLQNNYRVLPPGAKKGGTGPSLG